MLEEVEEGGSRGCDGDCWGSEEERSREFSSMEHSSLEFTGDGYSGVDFTELNISANVTTESSGLFYQSSQLAFLWILLTVIVIGNSLVLASLLHSRARYLVTRLIIVIYFTRLINSSGQCLLSQPHRHHIL